METRHITYDCQNKSIGVTFALDNEADTVQWQTGYILAKTTHVVESKSIVAWWVVYADGSKCQVSSKSIKWLQRCGDRKISLLSPIPLVCG